MTQCAVCSRSGSVDVLTTYKSLWDYCNACGGFSRRTRNTFPLEGLSEALLRGPADHKNARALWLLSHLGKRRIAENYSYYATLIDDYLRTRDAKQWTGQWDALKESLRSLGLSLERRSILDVSGEPGYFAVEHQQKAKAPALVTAYAASVVPALRKLGLAAAHYDFNSHSLTDQVQHQQFGAILVRYAIGFCENVPKFLKECAPLLEAEGLLIIQWSPSTRAICSRWMFDDYTYLRGYTREWLLAECLRAGFREKGVVVEEKERFDAGRHWVVKGITSVYRNVLTPRLRAGGPWHDWQYNETLVLTRP